MKDVPLAQVSPTSTSPSHGQSVSQNDLSFQDEGVPTGETSSNQWRGWSDSMKELMLTTSKTFTDMHNNTLPDIYRKHDIRIMKWKEIQELSKFSDPSYILRIKWAVMNALTLYLILSPIFDLGSLVANGTGARNKDRTAEVLFALYFISVLVGLGLLARKMISAYHLVKTDFIPTSFTVEFAFRYYIIDYSKYCILNKTNSRITAMEKITLWTMNHLRSWPTFFVTIPQMIINAVGLGVMFQQCVQANAGLTIPSYCVNKFAFFAAEMKIFIIVLNLFLFFVSMISAVILRLVIIKIHKSFHMTADDYLMFKYSQFIQQTLKEKIEDEMDPLDSQDQEGQPNKGNYPSDIERNAQSSVSVPKYQPNASMPSNYPPNASMPSNYQPNAMQPNYQPNAMQPNYQLNASVPNYQFNASAPNYQLNASAPNYQLNASAPNYQLNASAPNYQLNASAPPPPNYQPNASAPNNASAPRLTSK